MQTDSRRRRRHGFAPPSELLDELADLNEEGTARHLERVQELEEADTIDTIWDRNRDEMRAVNRELHKLQRTLLKLSERVYKLIEHQDRLNAQWDALRARDRNRNQDDLRDHRESGRLNCAGQADVRRRQQGQRAKVIIQGQVGRMEVR